MGKPGKKSQKKKFSLKERIISFGYAFHGMGTLLSEHNARIHLLILVFVVGAGIVFRISGSEWMAVLFVAGLVLVSECFNTAVEYLSDQISDEPNENIRKAKDVAAAGVLIAAIISVITGLIIFIPEILRHLRG
ncbi:MAG: diacylglycerol kinase family protein [Bacteroidales bacterium]|nr:diacylglycerol kinase family protein [Bacteroidales bacterium]MBK8884690.1 diacylglycerol kinase family protein [Bacteroidales bacterium]